MRTWVLIFALMCGSPPAAAAVPAVAEARASVRAAETEVVRLSTPAGPRAPAMALEQEKRLEAADRQLRAAKRELRTALETEMARLEARMKAALPRLKKGAVGDRRAAAREIQGWRAERAALVNEHAQLAQAETSAWADHLVEVDPLDGPEELQEKADFLADARDKLRAKRQMLATVLDDHQRRRRLARTARGFATDARLFDEQTRPGRILSDGSGGSEDLALAPPAENAAPPGSPTSPGTSDPTDGGGAEGGGRGNDGFNAQAGLDGSSFNRGVTAPEDAEAQTPTLSDPVPSVGPEGLGAATRDLSPALDLNVMELSEDASPKELQAWLDRLERAEKALERRRRAILGRAQQLED